MFDPAQAKRAEGGTVFHSRPQFILTLEELVTERNLFEAYKCASRGKKGRPGIFNFADDLGMNLELLRQELLSGTYRPYPCRQFEIFCRAGQKKRIISAPAFRDQVVQHLLYQNTYSAFDRGFIFDSYGCRRGKGTHRAADRTQHFIRKSAPGSYYLQIDIRKYYYSIQHNILRPSIVRRIQDSRIVDLFMLFCDAPSGVGLNVGCLTSQLFGMIYLDRFDHWVKRQLNVRHYIRYVDDMVFIGHSQDECREMLVQIESYLSEELKLSLSKWRIRTLESGINFAGFWNWRERRFVRKHSLHTLTKRIRQERGDSIGAVLAHARHTSSYGSMLEKLSENLPFERRYILHRQLREELESLEL